MALLARGLSNREIAAALVISERTAHTHVGNVLGKLGLHARAQVAAWALHLQELRDELWFPSNREVRVQNLDCDLTREHRVGGAIHGRHASPTDLFVHRVTIL